MKRIHVWQWRLSGVHGERGRIGIGCGILISIVVMERYTVSAALLVETKGSLNDSTKRRRSKIVAQFLCSWIFVVG